MDQVDLGAVALEPGDELSDRFRRRNPSEADDLEELDRPLDVVGPHLERYVVEHAHSIPEAGQTPGRPRRVDLAGTYTLNPPRRLRPPTQPGKALGREHLPTAGRIALRLWSQREVRPLLRAPAAPIR